MAGSVPESAVRHIEGQSRLDRPPTLLASSTFRADEMEIILADDRPYYTNLDEVSGLVRYAKDLQVDGMVLLLHFMGIAQVVQLEWCQAVAQYRTVHTEWPFIKETTQVDIDVQSGSSPFAFNIPSFLQPLQCPVGELHHMELPPSTRTGKDGRKDASENGSNLWQVVYQVRAELVPLDNPHALKYVNLPIRFLPQTRIPKALLCNHESSAPGSLSITKRLTNLLGQSQGSLTLTTSADATLHISSTDGRFLSNLSIDLQYKGLCPPPRLTKVSMTLLLRTRKRTRHNPADYHDESRISIERALMPVCGKQHTLSEWRQSNTALHTYDNRIDLPVVLSPCDKESGPLPTFESCLIARTYDLRLTLSLATTSTIPLRQKIFEIPVILEARLEPRPTIDSRAKDAEVGTDGDCCVPSYEAAMQYQSPVAPITRVPEYSDPIPDFELTRLPYWQEKAQCAEMEEEESIDLACTNRCAQAC